MVVLVGIVGVTGSGKSSLIKRLTGREDIAISDSLDSVTKKITHYEIEHERVQYALVDTPGFDDSVLDDEDIFYLLADWLERSFRKGQRLNGLLYLHPVISNRQKGSEIRNLRMFKKLCGDENFKNVVLGLTFCDQEPMEILKARAKELMETPEWWGDMVSRGSVVRAVPLHKAGCLKLLTGFAAKKDMVLQIQDEVVEQGIGIKDTAAAHTLPHRAALDAIKADEQLRLKSVHEEFLKRFQKAAADNEARAKREKAKFVREQRRQLTEELRLQRLIEEEQAEVLLLRKEEEEDRKLQLELVELNKNIVQTQLSNARLDELVKDRNELTRLLPRMRHRQLDLNSRAEDFLQELAVKASKQSIWTNNWPGKPPEFVRPGVTFSQWIFESFCHYCLATLQPGMVIHVCRKCLKHKSSMPQKTKPSSNTDLILCSKCFDKRNHCFNREHLLTHHKLPKITKLNECARLKRADKVRCLKCTAPVGSRYFHCCDCDNDGFDLCVKCWGKGMHCPKKDENHKLYFLGRCPSEFSAEIQPASSKKKDQRVQAIAMFDFKGDRSGDLSFRKGDIITISKKTETHGWWRGSINERVGDIPSNYVMVKK